MTGNADARRDLFDLILEGEIRRLPGRVHDVLDEVPLVVLDTPTPDLWRELEEHGLVDPRARLAGLHTGRMRTHRSVEESASAPNQIFLFRDGIAAMSGGWPSDIEHSEALREQIRITLLHEIGHELGLYEDDLDALGYA